MGELTYTLHAPAAAADSAPPPATALFIEQNELRQANGLPLLQWSRLLSGVAIDRLQDMGTRSYFDHVTPEGRMAYVDALAARGVLGAAWVGENLALDGWRSGVNPGFIAERNFEASQTHRENMLWSGFDHCGIGYLRWSDGREGFCVIFVGGWNGFVAGDEVA